MEPKSQAGELNKTDWKAIGRGAFVATLGALATYLVTVLPSIDWVQFGKYAPILTAAASILVNILRKYASGK